MNWNDWNLESNDKKFLVLVTIFSLFITFKMLQYHMSGGMYSPDKCIYMINAYHFAGLDTNNITLPSQMYYTPVVCFLTSFFFRMGLVDKLAIFIVSIIIGFSGNIGLYILLRNRFNGLLSLFGAILYGSFSVFLMNISSGLIDVPSVTISIWILVFTLIAVNNNEKYFILIFPLLVIGFFTRFTVGFILPVILLYYLINKDFIRNIDEIINDLSLFKKKLLNYIRSSEFKYIFCSGVIAVVLFCLICKITLDFGASLTFFEQTSDAISSSSNQILDKLYYVKNLPTILFDEERQLDSTLAYSVCLIIFVGVFLRIINFLKNWNFVSECKENKLNYKNNYFKKLLYIVLVISLVGFIVGFKFYSTSLIANFALFIFLLVLFSLIQQFNINKKMFSFYFLIFAWFSFYFVFISLYGVQIPRYAIPFLPAFACIVVYCLDNILQVITNGFDEKNLKIDFSNNLKLTQYSKASRIVTILLILIFTISTISFIAPMEIDGFPNGLVDVADYIKEHDPDYHSKDIISYEQHFQIIRWYLKENVITVPNAELNTINSTDADYVIINQNLTYNDYHQVFNSNGIYLYEHN